MVGATSRPDLLDAALLRPGRLDRLLLCGLPGADDRAAILAALAQPLRLAPGVDLPALAAAAEHFTGVASNFYFHGRIQVVTLLSEHFIGVSSAFHCRGRIQVGALLPEKKQPSSAY